MPITIDVLKDLFNAERIQADPHKEEIDFVERRAQIEKEYPDFFSIEKYLYNFELFKSYGLEDEMLKRIEHEIWYMSHYKSSVFYQSEFYKRFKNKRIVQKHFDESRIEMQYKTNL